MGFIYAFLAIVAIVSVVGYVGMQFWAYQEVENINSWSQQARTLNAWWIFDKTLLPSEHDHLRITARWCALTATVSIWALILLWERFQ
jgi:hypothetical protein